MHFSNEAAKHSDAWASWGNQWNPPASRAPGKWERMPGITGMLHTPHGRATDARIGVSAVPETGAHPSIAA
jgi:hypothetical protein